MAMTSGHGIGLDATHVMYRPAGDPRSPPHAHRYTLMLELRAPAELLDPHERSQFRVAALAFE
jgi:hypothetical protein